MTGPQEAVIEDRTAPVIIPKDEGPQEAVIEDRNTPVIISKDQGSTIHPEKVEASRLHVTEIKGPLIRQKSLNVSDTSSLKHKHHENIRIQFQASSQDTKGPTSKEPGAVEQQDALGYLHGPEPALSTQDKKTSSKLQALPPVLQKSNNKSSYRSSRFKDDRAKKARASDVVRAFQILFSVLVLALAAYTVNFYTSPYPTVPNTTLAVAGCSVCILAVRPPRGGSDPSALQAID
jgi:hypothetical protein